LISSLLNLILSIRNYFYHRGWFKSVYFENPKSIVVGNLSLGGSGKSPLIHYLIENWPFDGKIAVLSRGYGRKTKGFRKLTKEDNSETGGDEPMTYVLTYPKLPVFVGEKRVEAIEKIKEIDSKIDFVLLDDGFQHQHLQGNVNIVCTPYQNLFYQDYMWPKGKLREPRPGIQRADIVLVTKCTKSISIQEKEDIMNRIHDYHLSVPIYFSVNEYEEPTKGLFKKWVAFAGIATPDLFFQKMEKLGKIQKKITFVDHHDFTEKEFKRLDKIASELDKDTGIITTYKDYVRILPYLKKYKNLHKNLGYLPHKLKIQDSKSFWKDLKRILGD
jgi:tetraacyldisaccharide 4'-kinase